MFLGTACPASLPWPPPLERLDWGLSPGEISATRAVPQGGGSRDLKLAHPEDLHHLPQAPADPTLMFGTNPGVPGQTGATGR